MKHLYKTILIWLLLLGKHVHGQNNAIFSGGNGSGYSVICSSVISFTTVLPVELTQFEGSCSNGNIYLNWITASETNNAQFIVEQSFDGINWDAVSSYAGTGNSNTQTIYQHTQPIYQASEDLLYFRLKQCDYDGKYAYSKIIAVSNCADTKLELYIYPNPSSNNFWVEINSPVKELQLNIYTFLGELVVSKLIDSEKKLMHINDLNLSCGTYVIHLQQNHFTLASTKLIIQQ